MLEKSVNAPNEDGSYPYSYVEAMPEDMPHNRILAFQSGSKLETEQKEVFPIFFDAEPSDEDVALREYGYLVTTVEVIVKQQIKNPRKRGEKQTYSVKEIFLPFQGVYRVEGDDKRLTVYYSQSANKIIEADEELKTKDNTLILLKKVFLTAIRCGWTKNTDQIMYSLLQPDIEYSQREKEMIDNSDIALKYSQMNQDNKNFQNTATLGNMPHMKKEFNLNQINDRFGDGQGHGHVAEQYGNTIDTLMGKRTERLGGTHEKYGADRLVNGHNVQTKFNSTAGKSVGQMFDTSRHTAKYINPDGTMMSVEVPKDQYSKSVKLMRKRITNGEVPNESNPDNAAHYVTRSHITYESSQIATKSVFDRPSDTNIKYRDSVGNIRTRRATLRERAVISAGGDLLTGAAASIPAATISMVWIYVNSRAQGLDKASALKNGLYSAGGVIIQGSLIYMTASQFAGAKWVQNGIYNVVGKQFTKETIAGSTSILITLAIIQLVLMWLIV